MVSFSVQYVGQEQFIAVPIDIQRFVKRNLARVLLFRRKYIKISFSIQREAYVASLIFLRVKRIHRLNQTDGTNRYQILDVNAGVLEFAGNVNDQTQVTFDKHGTGGRIPGRRLLEQELLFSFVSGGGAPRFLRYSRFPDSSIAKVRDNTAQC